MWYFCEFFIIFGSDLEDVSNDDILKLEIRETSSVHSSYIYLLLKPLSLYGAWLLNTEFYYMIKKVNIHEIILPYKYIDTVWTYYDKSKVRPITECPYFQLP